MDDYSLACYRLGLRLQQATLIQKHVDQSSGAVADRNSARTALGRLAVAFGEWMRLLESEMLPEFGTKTLAQAFALPSPEIAGRLQTLASTCLEWASTRSVDLAKYGAWLRLGLALASVQYVPPARRILVDDEPRQPDFRRRRARWCWEDRDGIDSLLTKLQITLERLFPEHEPTHPVDGFAVDLPEVPYSPGWVILEVGLVCLMEESTAGVSIRPCHDRDRQFLEWYEAEGEATYRSPTKIQARWNELHKNDKDAQVTKDVVVKGIQRARKDRDARKQ